MLKDRKPYPWNIAHGLEIGDLTSVAIEELDLARAPINHEIEKRISTLRERWLEIPLKMKHHTLAISCLGPHTRELLLSAGASEGSDIFLLLRPDENPVYARPGEQSLKFAWETDQDPSLNALVIYPFYVSRERFVGDPRTLIAIDAWSNEKLPPAHEKAWPQDKKVFESTILFPPSTETLLEIGRTSDLEPRTNTLLRGLLVGPVPAKYNLIREAVGLASRMANFKPETTPGEV